MSNKHARRLNVLLGILCMVVIWAVPLPVSAMIGVIVASDVNIRNGPGADYSVLTQADRGGYLRIIGEKADWYKVALHNGQTGWVARKFIEVVKSSLTEEYKGIVNGDIVNVRSGPGTEFPVITRLYYGTEVAVTGEEGEWRQIKLPSGASGWVARWLVKEQNPTIPAIIINGETIPAKVAQAAVDNGIVTVSSAVMEKLGATVTRQPGTQDFVFQLNGRSVKLRPGVAEANSEGRTVTLEAAPVLQQDWLIIPLKSVGTLLGVAVETNAANTTVWLSIPTFEYKAEVAKSTDGFVSRLTFVVNTALPYTVQDDNPQKLTLVFPGALSFGKDTRGIYDGLIKTLRIIRDKDANTTKIEISLAAPAKYNICSLPRQPGQPQQFTVEFDRSAISLTGKKIVIDPGHGGSDPGAIGSTGSREKEVTLAIARDLRKILDYTGAEVVLTRNDDRSVGRPDSNDRGELQARCDIAQKEKADVFISIHNNSFYNPASSGVQVFYASGNGSPQASSRLARLTVAALAENTQLKNRGASDSNFYVLNHTKMPAILAEVGFLSNPAEERLLLDPDFQWQSAQGLYEGIRRYFAEVGKEKKEKPVSENGKSGTETKQTEK